MIGSISQDVVHHPRARRARRRLSLAVTATAAALAMVPMSAAPGLSAVKLSGGHVAARVFSAKVVSAADGFNCSLGGPTTAVAAWGPAEITVAGSTVASATGQVTVYLAPSAPNCLINGRPVAWVDLEVDDVRQAAKYVVCGYDPDFQLFDSYSPTDVGYSFRAIEPCGLYIGPEPAGSAVLTVTGTVTYRSVGGSTTIGATEMGFN
jgi:hypothetical protein